MYDHMPTPFSFLAVTAYFFYKFAYLWYASAIVAFQRPELRYAYECG